MMTTPDWTPDWAMVFAAGKGERMRPLTDTRPKPMLEVAGQPLLGHTLDSISEAGIANVVVNAHHCANVVEQYLPTRTTPPHIFLSHEPTLLDTGGGVKKALADGTLATLAPFLAANSDILLINGAIPAIQRLVTAWNRLNGAADVLLLLMPQALAWGNEKPHGDYLQRPDGTITRLGVDSSAKEFVYAGLQITRPELYSAPELGDCFSNLAIFDRAEKAGRLYGLVHDGNWYHFSTPQALALFQQTQPALSPIP
jgi:MurNAc alpha-1-phosphate uridylyltransferase